MIKLININSGDIRYFERDVNISDWVDLGEYRLMTEDEVDRHENPQKYWTDKQLSKYNRSQMPNLTPIEFDIKLIDAGLYEQVQELINQDLKLKVAYIRATFFSRTDPFIEQARIALNLTDEQIDEMWNS